MKNTNFFPSAALWLHIIGKAIALFRKLGTVTVDMWEDGTRYLLLNSKTVALVAITRSAVVVSHTLKFEVYSKDTIFSRRVFSQIAVAIGNELLDNKITGWKAYAEVTRRDGDGECTLERIGLDEKIDKELENGRTEMLVGELVVSFFDIVPERIFMEYKGSRYALNQLQVGDILGQGGFATVYKGMLYNRPVAVKVLNQETDPLRQVLAMEDFRKEFMVQNNLSHQNLLHLLGICMRPMSIVMELCSMGELWELLKSTTEKISWALHLRIAIDVALGLKFLQDHTPSIVHLDLKSRNVLLVSKDPNCICAKICDFGTSQFVDPKTGYLTESGVDNPVYQAPEILEGKPFNSTADIYSYGVLLWEILSQEDYCKDFSYALDIVHHVTAGKREPIPVHSPKLYTHLVTSCWHADPKRRCNISWVISTLRYLNSQIPLLEKWHTKKPRVSDLQFFY